MPSAALGWRWRAGARIADSTVRRGDRPRAAACTAGIGAGICGRCGCVWSWPCWGWRLDGLLRW